MSGLKRGDSGRSMVEILGVLAIVAVLTIGGIIGYGYAMDYYRENETLDAYNKTAAGSLTGRIMENYGSEAEASGSVSVPFSEVISGVDKVNDYIFRTAVGARIEVKVNNSHSFSIHAADMSYGACRKLVMARDLGYTYAYVDDGGASFASALSNPDAAGTFCAEVDSDKLPGGDNTDFVMCFGGCEISCGGECPPCFAFTENNGVCSCVPVPDCTCDAARDCTPCEQCDEAGQCAPDPAKVNTQCDPSRCCNADGACTATCECAPACAACEKCIGNQCVPDPSKNNLPCAVCKKCQNGRCQHIPNCRDQCTPADGPCCGNSDPCCGNPDPCECNPAGPCCTATGSCACQPNQDDCDGACTPGDLCCGSTDECCGESDPCACDPTGVCCTSGSTSCDCRPNDPCCESDDPCCADPDACSGCPVDVVPVSSGTCCEGKEPCCPATESCVDDCTPAPECDGGGCPAGKVPTWVP